MTEKINPSACVLLLSVLLSGCSLAPDFKLPEIAFPGAYKEAAAEVPDAEKKGQWKVAEALEKEDRGQWWKIFKDEQMNALQRQALEANQSLKIAFARVEAARATVRANASTLFPKIELGADVQRSQPSSASVAAFGGNTGTQLKPYTLYEAQAMASYELDLFGRVRDGEKALRTGADAEEAMYRGVLLALQADVAQHYFFLRALDSERKLLRETVGIRTEALRIMQRRFEQGVSGEQDVTRTQSELALIQAELLALDRKRAEIEHALAVLLGKMPSEFAFAELPLGEEPPQIPPGLPSRLLERRPDVAAAESAMAAANARIGVARTAFFPILALTASGGVESMTLGDLLQWSSRTWALGQMAGSALSWTIFDSGRNMARLDVAKANYDEAVATYRQQVLVAFREVEDALASQRLLAAQAERQDAAARAASRTTSLVSTRYDEGDINYFEVVDAQRTSLAAERGAVQTRGQRFQTMIGLIRALGGGWEVAQAPDAVPVTGPSPAPEPH